MMEYDEMLTVLSACFAPVEKDEWEQFAARTTWSDFLDAVRRALQDDGSFGAPTSPIARARTRCPLQEFLSAGEVKALFAPPTHDEKRAFSARHFTGGLPASAMPVESLYTGWSNGALPSPFSRCEGMYQGDSARYMQDVVERMGMHVPAAFAAYPDHLALELDLAALLLRSGMRDAACQFLTERLAWLTAYRLRLLELEDDDARFYVGLVDVLLGIRAQLGATEDVRSHDASCECAREAVHSASNDNRLHACI